MASLPDAAPQAGEHGSHWGAVGRVRVEGFRAVEVRAGPEARSVDGARAESTSPLGLFSGGTWQNSLFFALMGG